MMEYILLIHRNAGTPSSSEEWDQFLASARQSGLFRGGSAIGDREILGAKPNAGSSDHIVGFMRFDSDDKQKLLDLLKLHPVLTHGGTVELCELPKT